MALEEYRRKRSFAKTPEPKGRTPRLRAAGLSFVVQKHAASRLHYDFRLELDGVLKSWAIPRGPSPDPADKRLAVEVEDHPLDYGGFEGTIPQGEYGGGTVMLWDRGIWAPEDDPHAGYAKGHLRFVLSGDRLKGGWSLIRMADRSGGKKDGGRKNWLLVKERDDAARPGEGDALVEAFQTSVASGRGMAEIAEAKDHVWRSKPARKSAPALAPAVRVSESPRKAAALPGARPGRMPAVPQPQLATLVDAAPEGEDWVHEIKLDGYRMLARIAKGRVILTSRNGNDWTDRFPAIAAALAELPVPDAVIDGEIVHLEPDGISSFAALKEDLSAGRTADDVYYVFDLLHLDGRGLTAAPLIDRKAALAGLLAGAGAGRIRLSEHIVGRGGAFFAKACGAGLEGIISKRAAAPYTAGRSHTWLKVKCMNRDEFVVLGWTDPAGSRKGLGALLLGYYDKAGTLCYAGGVGTGFTAATLAELRRKLDALARKAAPAKDIAAAAPRHARWVAPKLVAQIQYASWTRDVRLRHAAFLGLREDKEPREVTFDPASPAAAPPPPAAPAAAATGFSTEIAGIRLSHPGKILYPADGFTKLDLANYYVAVADHMLPLLRDRPIALVRCPGGAGKKCFFQKHPGEGVSPSLGRIEIEEKEGTTTYLLVDDVAALVALVQMDVLEIHLWGSTRKSLEKPDRVILDLDPDEGLPWERVTAAALAMRDLLAEMGLQSFAKTTGGKGLHVVLPLRPKYDWEEIKAFARSLAAELARRHPESYTASLPKAARRGKIFVDYLRNQRGATAVAPYSARARPGAPVSCPVTWQEVEAGMRSDRFTIKTLPQRLAQLRQDPWVELADVKQALPVSILRELRSSAT